MKIFLFIHIIGGTLTLLAGFIALATKKGARLHRLSGKIFLFAMAASLFASVILSLAKQNLFLLMIGIFSLYMLWSGYRALFFLRDKNRRANPLDYALSAVNFFACAGGIFLCVSQKNLPGIIFGGMGIIFSVLDLRQFRVVEINPKLWLAKHIAMMCGAYISAVTAFLVVNFSARFGVIVWLAPTLIGSPLIAYFTRKYTKPKKNFSPNWGISSQR